MKERAKLNVLIELSRNSRIPTGIERLTVEAAVFHLELLEVRECAPFGRDSASELVQVKITSADVEHLE